MEKKKYIFFIFIVFIFLFFLLQIQSMETMDKKEAYLIKDKKYMIELHKNKNQKYANEIIIDSIDDNDKKFTKDVSNINVWKLEVGDIDGDGIDEVGLGVYTQSPLHPIDAKRPYIYSFSGIELIPKWRGSRLSRPFVDFVFYDVDKDKTDEILSIELLEDGAYIINSYKWKGFGFEGYLESKRLEVEPTFYRQDDGIYIQVSEDLQYYKLEVNKENTRLEWRKEDES